MKTLSLKLTQMLMYPTLYPIHTKAKPRFKAVLLNTV